MKPWCIKKVKMENDDYCMMIDAYMHIIQVVTCMVCLHKHVGIFLFQ